MFDKNLWQQSKEHFGFFILSVVFGVGLGVLIILQAKLLSEVIAGVFIDGLTLQDVTSQLKELLLIIGLRGMVVILREFTAGELSIRVRSDLRQKLYEKVLGLGPIRLGEERTGELVNTVVEGVERLDAYFKEYLPQLLLAAIIPILILFFVFPIDWISGVIFLVTAPLIPLFMMLIGRQAEKETQRQFSVLGRLSAHFLDILQGLTTLKNFGQSKGQRGTIRKASERYAQLTLRVLRIAFLSALVLEMLATISTAVVAVQIGLRLMYAKVFFVDALFLLILAPEFYFPLRQLGASFHAGMDGIATAERIFAILSLPQPEEKFSAQIAPNTSLQQRIVFEDVHFAYQDGERPALHGVSFELHKGETVALVGKSGSGKSTIAALAAGLIVPDTGTIQVDGHPLLSWQLEDWQRQVSWVSQFPYLFNQSIMENLRLGKPEAIGDEIERAIQLAQAEEFITQLPKGDATLLGDRGARLSGGQVQRLAIARALLKDAPIVVMDEPAANLDPMNEGKLLEAMAHLLRDRTVLMIAHRLSSVRRADRILVLEQGRIVQQGKHEELVGRAGFYQDMVGEIV